METVNLQEMLDSDVSLQVVWRPPTKNSDQIDSYKIMMASTSGVVRELAQGNMLRYFVNNLTPASEYIFSVKAIYRDGSFLWSEPKAFSTKAR
jgi:hypothetical protein